MKAYIKPETEIIELQGGVTMAELSAIDPDNSGGDIYGGDGDSNTHPLDAKENNGAWGGWDSDGEDW